MTKRSLLWMAVLLTGRASMIVLGATCASAQTNAVSEPEDVNGAAGVVAEVTQCKRESGVLSIRVRFRNTTDSPVSVTILNGNNYDEFYVTAGNKKYFVLRDTDKTPLANSPTNYGGAISVNFPKGGTFTWYAKYQAPPDDVKKINYYTPITPPFEDVPITD